LKLILDPNGDIPHYDSWYVEQLNGAMTLEFTVPADLPDVAKIENDGRAVIRDRDGNLVEFIIRLPEDSDGENGPEKHVFAEGGAYELIDEWLPGYTAANVTLKTALEAVLSNTRWSVGTVDDFGTQSVNIEPTTVKNAIMQLLEIFGGEIRYRVEADGNRIVMRYVDILKQRGRYSGKRFEMGKDILSITHAPDSTGIKTALYGYGAAQANDGPRITFADVEWSVANGDPVDKPKGQLWVGDPEALKKWGYAGGTRHRFGVYSGQEEDPAELLLNTWKDLQKRTAPTETSELQVALLQDVPGYEHERVRLGDLVSVIDRRVQPNIETQANIIEYRQNLNDDRLDEVVVGQFRNTFDTAGRVRNTEQIIDNKQGNWDKKETPQGALEKANQKAQEAIQEAQKRIDAAKQELSEAITEIDNAKVTIDEAQALIDDTIANPQNYKGDFVGDLIADSLIVRGPIISENATITGQIIASGATFLQATMDRANIINANIQEATITGTLSSVDGTFTGDLIGATIYAAETSFVGDSLYITNNLYLGRFTDRSPKTIHFNDSCGIVGGTGWVGAGIDVYATELNINSGQTFIKGTLYSDRPETGYCGAGAMGIAGYYGNVIVTGVNFRIKKTYTPSSINYTTLTGNRTPNFVDISQDGFGLAIPSNDINNFAYWRGYYTA
jgi:phage minor structural protein